MELFNIKSRTDKSGFIFHRGREYKTKEHRVQARGERFKKGPEGQLIPHIGWWVYKITCQRKYDKSFKKHLDGFTNREGLEGYRQIGTSSNILVGIG